mmetsp:Transcript_113854/g.322006  ORF Transcript_113854/g.322006 Transcript_113854/m.322006 type:complete len:298 (-) Transcript_113854:53-946(-)
MDSVNGTPRNSHATPWNFVFVALSLKRYLRKERKGAMPVPVASMMMFDSGSSGSSISAPVGPVRRTSSPAFRSQMWFEHTPRYTFSASGNSGSLPGSTFEYSHHPLPETSTTRLTQRDTVFEVSSSPQADDAIEYNLTLAGFSPFLSGPGAMTPADWPSRYGYSPLWSMTQWHVSQFTSDVFDVMVSFETQVALYGAFGAKRFHGISFPSTTRTPFFFAAVARRAVAFALLQIAAAAAMEAKPSNAFESPVRPWGVDDCWAATETGMLAMLGSGTAEGCRKAGWAIAMSSASLGTNS